MTIGDNASGVVATVIHRAQGVTIVNTTTETSVFSITLPGNALGTASAVRFRAAGTSFNNAASSTIRYRVKYGGTTMYDGTTASYTAVATRRPVEFYGTLHAAGATGSQTFTGRVTMGSATAPTTGTGSIATSIPLYGTLAGTASVDSTANQTFEITVQHSSASANLELDFDSIIVELLQ